MDSKLKLHNPLTIGIIAVFFGALLINLQDRFISIIIMILGGLALLIGLILFFKFLAQTKNVEKRWSMFPVSVLICGVFGVLLLSFPALWSSLFVRVLGLVVMFLSLMQVVYLIGVRKRGVNASFAYYVFPIMLFLVGIYTLINPIDITSSIIVISGIMFILYGISEIVNYFLLDKNKQENTIIKDNENDKQQTSTTKTNNE